MPVERTSVRIGEGDDPALLRSQGCFLSRWSSPWRIGELSLTARRLAFAQSGRLRFELPLARISALAVRRRKFILLRKEIIALTYTLENKDGDKQVGFIVPELGRWLEKLVSLTGAGEGPRRLRDERERNAESAKASARWISPPVRAEEPVRVGEDQVRRLAAAVNPAAACVLWRIWQTQHADLEELANLIDAPTHMDVLTLLREGINEPARRLLGGPVLVFKERALDRRSGRAVCFHWWLERDEETNDSAPAAADDEPSPVEIHDEGEALLVLIAAPDAKLETLKTEVRGRRLRLAVETAGGPFELAAPLPCRVAGAPIKVAFSNAVLSLWLAKETGR